MARVQGKVMMMMVMMILPKRLVHTLLKGKNLKMGYRGRLCLPLIFAVMCAVIYFAYVLNSASDDKGSKYYLDESVVEAGPGKYSPTEDHLDDSVEKDLKDLRSDQNSSDPVKNTLDQVTSAYSDRFVGRHDNLDVPKVSDPEIQKSFAQHQHLASDIPISRNLPTHSSADKQEFNVNSKQETSRNSIIFGDSDFKLVHVNKSVNRNDDYNESVKQEFPGMTDDVLKRIEENLINWKRKEESRLVEERKFLEEGKQKLLEEKMRFQQEMSRVMQGLHRGNIVDMHRKFASRPHYPVNSSNWEGLNNSFIDSHFPGVVFLKDYRLGRPFVAPEDATAAGMQGSPQSLSEMLDSQAEERFFQLISEVHLDCVMIQRMGSLSDGGWDVCTVPPYDLNPGCVVYSFGINYDFTFDDAMAASFDCTVKAFDPSMSVGDHVRSAKVHFYQLGLGAQNTVTNNGWKLGTFRHIRKKLGHDKSIIDILKIDIEFYEWECLRNMISDNSLENVKQLMFEMHTPEVAMVQKPSTKEDFKKMYDLLSDLEKAGFRRYNVHMNPLGQYTSSRTGKTRSCCFELYYVNIRFLKI